MRRRCRRKVSVNVDSGELSYCVDSQGATIRLTVDDALTVARALLEFARRIDGPVAEVIDLEAWRSGE
jgi:hypothetical protein